MRGKITKFNYIKLEAQNGRWFTYSNPSKQKLQRLISGNPKNIYISVNKYLNYKEHNSTYRFQNRIMFRYGLIDIDSQDFSSKDKAIICFNEILSFLQKKKIQISEINATNIQGGFQIIIHHNSYKKFKYLLTSSLLRNENLFKKIDFRVFDDKRVRRYSPSWNSNKNSPVIPLFNEEIVSLPFGVKTSPNVFNERQSGGQIPPLQSQDLNSSKRDTKIGDFWQTSHPFNKDGLSLKDGDMGNRQNFRQKLLESFSKAEGSQPSPLQSLGMPIQADDNEVVESTPPRSEQRQGQENESNLPCHFLVRQMSSSVSPNNYVPVLKFPVKPSLKRIRRLQKAYNLSNLLLFKNQEGFMAISPKVCQKKRLYKIYKKAGCWKSLNELQKFKNQWVYISNIFNLQTKQTEQTFKFLDVIENEADGWYSRPYLYWLSRFHKKEYPENRIIGSDKPKIYVAEFSRD